MIDFSNLRKNLEHLGYTVREFSTAKEASLYLTEAIQNCHVGFGGSKTLEAMGLFDLLSEKNAVHWHWFPQNNLSRAETLKKVRDAEIYISSVNGIAESGEIINIDGTGNRVAAISHGHQKVYLVIGENKIAPTFEDALYRARNVAAPLNAQRLGVDTPCAIKGEKCYDCDRPHRICRNLSVLWHKPTGAEYEIILIHENLGY